MKKPEEIKKTLAVCITGHCPRQECPYYGGVPSCAYRYTKDALAYIQQLEYQVPRWIPVEERLPEKYLRVLGACCMGVFETMYDGKYWRIAELPFEDTITHWMPLPEAPKEDAHE